MVVSWAKKLEIPRVSGTVLGVTSFNIRSLLLDNPAQGNTATAIR